jgi:peptide chain release factor 1
MLDKLAKIADRFEEITALLSQPEIISDSKRFQSLSREQAKIAALVEVFQNLTEKEQELEGNIEMSKDPEEDSEMRDMAKEEVLRLKKEISQHQEEAKFLLMPKNPDDEKNTILEIRAGTGGDEAALFVADLYRMYLKFAEQNKWRVDVMSSSSTGIGGFKEIVISIEGKNVYSRLKF